MTGETTTPNSLPDAVKVWLETSFPANPVVRNLLGGDARLKKGRVWEYLRKAAIGTKSVDLPTNVAVPIGDSRVGHPALATDENGRLDWADPGGAARDDDPDARLAEFVQFIILELSADRVVVTDSTQAKWLAGWRSAAVQCRLASMGCMPFPGLTVEQAQALKVVADYFDDQAASYEKSANGRYFRPDAAGDFDSIIRGRVATVSDRLFHQFGRRYDGIVTTLVTVGLGLAGGPLSREVARDRRRRSGR